MKKKITLLLLVLLCSVNSFMQSAEQQEGAITQSNSSAIQSTPSLAEIIGADPAFQASMQQTDRKVARFNTSNEAILFRAIDQNNIQALKDGLEAYQEAGIPIINSARDPRDLSLLAHAVTVGADLEIIKYLVSQGAATDFTHEYVTENRDGKMQGFKGDNLLELLFTQAPVALEYKNPDITNDELEEYLFEVAKFLMHHGAPYYEAAKTVPVPIVLCEDFEETPYLALVTSDTDIETMNKLLLVADSPHISVAEKNALDALNTVHNAASGTHFPKLHRLFEINKPPANVYNPTPLVQAIRDKDILRATELLRAGADPNKCIWTSGGTPLQAVVSTQGINQLEFIKLLVSYGADLNEMDDNGNTILLCLDNSTSDELLTFLASCNINTNKKDRSGNIALHNAAFKSFPRIIDFLIAQGASLESVNNKMQTPLLFLLANGLNQETISNGFYKLVSEGANVHATDKDGNSALHLAAGNNNCDTEIINMLVKDDHSDINTPNVSGETPLFSAIRRNNLPAVKALLANRASTTHINNAGQTPLDVAREIRLAVVADKDNPYIDYGREIHSADALIQLLERQPK